MLGFWDPGVPGLEACPALIKSSLPIPPQTSGYIVTASTATMASTRDTESRASDKHEDGEHSEKPGNQGDVLQPPSDDQRIFDVDERSLPPGYFRSPFFVGTMTGIGLGLMAGVAGFGYAAPILTLINNDIGPVSHPVSPV